MRRAEKYAMQEAAWRLGEPVRCSTCGTDVPVRLMIRLMIRLNRPAWVVTWHEAKLRRSGRGCSGVGIVLMFSRGSEDA